MRENVAIGYSSAYQLDSMMRLFSFNPLTPNSDKHLISPYKITSDSHIQVMGKKEIIIK